jgi:hypothetical protein
VLPSVRKPSRSKLQYDPGEALARGILKQVSGSETRCIKSPKSQNVSAVKVTASLGEHANFGSLACGHAV